MKKSTYMIWGEILALFLLIWLLFFDITPRPADDEPDISDNLLWAENVEADDLGDLALYNTLTEESIQEIRLRINTPAWFNYLDKMLIVYSDSVYRPCYRIFLPENWTAAETIDSTSVTFTFDRENDEWMSEHPVIVIILPAGTPLRSIRSDIRIDRFEIYEAHLSSLAIESHSTFSLVKSECDTLYMKNCTAENLNTCNIYLDNSSVDQILIDPTLSDTKISGNETSTVGKILWPEIDCFESETTPNLEVTGSLKYGMLSVKPGCKVSINLNTRLLINETDYVF